MGNGGERGIGDRTEKNGKLGGKSTKAARLMEAC